MVKAIVIHGPNMNLLGTREVNLYGELTLDVLNGRITDYAARLDVSVAFVQHNSEGEIIDQIHNSQQEFNYGIINPGAYTHYSLAIRDAISSVRIPFIEVHLSNVFAREEFRHKSVIAPVCIGSIAGFGEHSYCMALQYIKNNI